MKIILIGYSPNGRDQEESLTPYWGEVFEGVAVKIQNLIKMEKRVSVISSSAPCCMRLIGYCISASLNKAGFYATNSARGILEWSDQHSDTHYESVKEIIREDGHSDVLIITAHSKMAKWIAERLISDRGQSLEVMDDVYHGFLINEDGSFIRIYP